MAQELDADAVRRLYPLVFLESYLNESVRPDGRPLTACRAAQLSLGTVPTTEGSALVKVGNTTVLAGVKLEIAAPAAETPDQGCLHVEFVMPPICSPKVRPGRPAEETYVISEQLCNALSSSGLIDLKELSISHGKAAWTAYLDVYCLDADGSLLDASLLASVGALANLRLPAVSVADEGRVVTLLDPDGKEDNCSDIINSRKLTLGTIPHALTIAMNRKHLVADPTAEEESTLETTLFVVTDSSDRLVSFYKAGGPSLATTSTVQDCLALARRRRKELQNALEEAMKQQQDM